MVKAGTLCGIPAASAAVRAVFASSVHWRQSPKNHVTDEIRIEVTRSLQNLPNDVSGQPVSPHVLQGSAEPADRTQA